MLDVHKLMASLSAYRPVFHSEADFQHALAWYIHELMPDCEVRLEYPVSADDQKTIHLDIWLPKERLAIELKYFNKRLRLNCGGEIFDLKEHAASDLARKHFILDVQRIERVMADEEIPVKSGIAIVLTNDPRLWDPQRAKRKTNDINFRVHEGRHIAGELIWLKGDLPYEGEAPVRLNGAYDMRWQDYSDFTEEQYGQFRYLAVSVGL